MNDISWLTIDNATQKYHVSAEKLIQLIKNDEIIHKVEKHKNKTVFYVADFECAKIFPARDKPSKAKLELKDGAKALGYGLAASATYDKLTESDEKVGNSKRNPVGMDFKEQFGIEISALASHVWMRNHPYGDNWEFYYVSAADQDNFEKNLKRIFATPIDVNFGNHYKRYVLKGVQTDYSATGFIKIRGWNLAFTEIETNKLILIRLEPNTRKRIAEISVSRASDFEKSIY